MKRRTATRLWFILIWTGLCSLTGLIVAERVPALQYLQLQVCPQHYVRLTLPICPIAIRPETIERLGDPANYGLLRRERYAELLRGLKSAGAKEVIFDLDLHKESPDDAELRNEILHSAPMKLVFGVNAVSQTRSADGYDVQTGYSVPAVFPPLLPDNVTVGSSKSWSPDETLHGITVVEQDHSVAGQAMPHLAVAAWLAVNGLTPDDMKWDAARSAWKVADREWPVGSDGEYRCSWLDAPPAETEFADALKLLKTPAGKAAFKGRIVMLGSEDEVAFFRDRHATPVGEMSGLQFNLTVLNSLDQPPALQVTSAKLIPTFLLAWFAGTVGLFLISPLKPLNVLAGIALTSALVWAAPQKLEAWQITVGMPHLWLSVALAGLGYFGFVVGRQSRFLPRFFRERWREGQPQRVAALFVDVRKSTEMAARLGPQLAPKMMAEAIALMASVVESNGGAIERTLGDGLVALFFESNAKSYREACLKTIQELFDVFESHAAQFDAEYKDVPSITIGAESGEIRGTRVSGKTFEDWSHYGHAIVVAARLQALCDKEGVSCLLGPDLANGAHVSGQPLGLRQLKGLGSIELFAIPDSSSVRG